MSMKDKHKKQTKWTAGRRCPKCGKGRLENAKCGTKGHDNHVICKTCGSSNF